MQLENALNVPGWMFKPDLALLSTVAKHTPANSSFIEFGTFLGRSTRAISDNVNSTVQIHAVDIWDIKVFNPHSIYDDLAARWEATGGSVDQSIISTNFKNACDIATQAGTWEAAFSNFTQNNNYIDGTSNITNHCCTTSEFELPTNSSVVFIDADHSFEGARHDIQKIANRTDILLCGHDFVLKHTNGVVQALVEYMQCQSGNHMDINRTLIVLPNTSIWFLVPPGGYWASAFYEKVMPDYRSVANGLLKTNKYIA